MAYGVSMATGSWVGKHNLMVMPLDDFEIILGIDFLWKFQFVPFPHLDGVMVMNGSNARFLKGVHPFGNINKVAKKKDKGMLLSAMSIDKGMKKGDETILAALVEIKPDVKIEVPDCVGECLNSMLMLCLLNCQRNYHLGGTLIIRLSCYLVRLLLHKLPIVWLLKNWLNYANN